MLVTFVILVEILQLLICCMCIFYFEARRPGGAHIRRGREGPSGGTYVLCWKGQAGKRQGLVAEKEGRRG